MIEILPGYPDDVLAISGVGRVTSNDYRNVLIPQAEGRIARHGSLRLLYYLGSRYEGLDPAAAWSDLAFGLSHWSKFGRIALVTDVAWIRDAACLFAPFYHHAFRVFDAADLEAASAWIRTPDDAFDGRRLAPLRAIRSDPPIRRPHPAVSRL